MRVARSCAVCSLLCLSFWVTVTDKASRGARVTKKRRAGDQVVGSSFLACRFLFVVAILADLRMALRCKLADPVLRYGGGWGRPYGCFFLLPPIGLVSHAFLVKPLLLGG